MKKVLIITALWILLLFADANNISAQTIKYGYFDPDYVVSLMPGIERIDSLLEIYERDSLGQQYQSLVKEFYFYDSLMRVHDCGMRFTLDTAKNEAQWKLAYLLQNWQQYSQQTMQAKQQELIQPFYDKVMIAYQEVVDEGKYTYVFKRDALLHAPQPDNLSIAVIKKLGIKVTAEIWSHASPAISRTIAPLKFRSPIRK